MPDDFDPVEDLTESFREYRRTGDVSLRDELVEAHRWMAASSARRFANRGEPLDDLVQVADLGLVKAVERFDPELGRSVPRVRQADHRR